MARCIGGFAQSAFRLVLSLVSRIERGQEQHQVLARAQHGLAAVTGAARRISAQFNCSRIAMERPGRFTP